MMASSTMATFLLIFLSFHLCDSQYMNPNDNFVRMNSTEMKQIYPGQTGTNPFARLDWYRVVVLIMTYESESETKLLGNHFNSWIRKMPKGFDIVVVTDISDRRTYEEILPDANKVTCTVNLYKTLAKNEGHQAREKTIDSLRYIFEKYHNTHKEMFLKIDPDTYVVPENLLKITQEVYRETYPLPVDFGRVDCLVGGSSCFSLGASYGLNQSGLAAFLQYIKKQPQILDRVILDELGQNRMLDEDFFTSYVFRTATGYPTIHISGMSIRLQARNYLIQGPHEGEWDTTDHHITIHLVKEPEQFDILNKYYYKRGIALKKWYRLRL